MVGLADIAVAGRAFLAIVFFAAGIAKLVDDRSSDDIVGSFGLNGRLARGLSELLPAIEIAVGSMLVWPISASIGASVALVLLIGFSGLVVRSLRRGETPRCSCFGAASIRPIGRHTVWRNVALAVTALAVAAIAFRSPGPSLLAWTGGESTTEGLVLSCMLLGAIVVAMAGTIRRIGASNRSLVAVVDELEQALDRKSTRSKGAPAPDDGLPMGAPAPRVASRTVDGTHVSLLDLIAHGRPVLLFFLGADCAACKPLYPFIRRWALEARGRMTFAVLFVGQPARDAFGEETVVLTEDASKQAGLLRLQWTPSAVLVTRRGHIGSPVAVGHDAILRLAVPVVSSLHPEDAVPAGFIREKSLGLPFGSPGPNGLALPSAGERALIFWQSNCSYCRSLYPQLRRFIDNRRRDEGAPSVVVVNWGAEPVSDVDDLPRVDDPAGTLAKHYGVTGTPSALLIDADGHVASSVAAGGANVMALLGYSHSATP